MGKYALDVWNFFSQNGQFLRFLLSSGEEGTASLSSIWKTGTYNKTQLDADFNEDFKKVQLQVYRFEFHYPRS